MLQEIYPEIYHNEFTLREPEEDDLVFCFKKDEVLMFGAEDMLLAPTVDMMRQSYGTKDEELVYLFKINEDAVYLLHYTEEIATKTEVLPGMGFHITRIFRTLEPKWIAFAGITAGHLEKWYRRNQFCGCCGSKMEPKTTERAMRCTGCGFTDYPKICPAVIVGVIDGNRIMLTKYANRPFTRYALVAGFCEIGETVEDTIRREVLEEVGIRVKNMRYYKSQPWAFSESLLMGFFVELDGDGSVTLDTDELKEAVWVQREDIPDDTENGLSLTYTMMQAFKKGEIV